MSERELIEELVRDGYIHSPEIKRAFLAIHRADFVSEEHKMHAGENIPVPTGIDSIFVSQPSTAGFILELLKPKQGEKILVVGGGSGWIPGIIAHIVSKKHEHDGFVCVVEPNEDCSHIATRNLEKYTFISDGIVDVHSGVWDDIHETHGAYDAIIALRAIEEIPEVWRMMVRVGGRIIAPIHESIVMKEKKSATEYETKRYFGFNFPQFS